ncbi:MAG TPA: MogA/MoaB family molybdenum cofactor biosynthesis protein [Dehalococcoidia bacterium]|nr:MogA/MoaB family molybdenum cofactor biosynthesis protein [Dehalococcoidia bacterium]
MTYTVGVLTISDKGFQGQREDLSGPAIRRLVEQGGGQVARYLVLPDEHAEIARTLATWADEGVLDVVLTTGGTGLSPRDVTPEATKEVVRQEVPGIAEALRSESLKKTPMAMLSRGIAGVRGRTLIVNLPGSPKAVAECLEVLLPVLSHAVETLRESVEEHPRA